MSSSQPVILDRKYAPRSLDAGNTTSISVFAALGGLLVLLHAVVFIRWLAWKLRSRKRKQARKDAESVDGRNPFSTERTRVPSSNGDSEGRRSEVGSQSPSRANPGPIESSANRFEYRVLLTTPEAEARHISTFAVAPNSPLANDSVIDQTGNGGDTDSSHHTLESLSQDDPPQQTLATPPATARPPTRTISLMQREIDDLRARVDELTRQQQPGPTRHLSAATSSYSDTQSAPPSYSELGQHEFGA